MTHEIISDPNVIIPPSVLSRGWRCSVPPETAFLASGHTLGLTETGQTRVTDASVQYVDGARLDDPRWRDLQRRAVVARLGGVCASDFEQTFREMTGVPDLEIVHVEADADPSGKLNPHIGMVASAPINLPRTYAI